MLLLTVALLYCTCRFHYAVITVRHAGELRLLFA